MRASCLPLLFLPVAFSSGRAQDSAWIRNARVFDGSSLLEASEVWIRGERIEAVGSDLVVPEDALVVDAEQAFLMPGLIDCHTHTFAASMLAECSLFGVTTVLDMFTSVGVMRELQQDAPGRASFLSAGVLATAPGGHGTQFGVPIPTLTSPEEALAFVQARKEEGSDYLKIVFDDGRTRGRPWPTLSIETVRALVEAAHEADLLAVVHVLDHESAVQALGAGADGLVHTYIDRDSEGRIEEVARDSGAFVIPTLSVIQSVCGVKRNAELASDPALEPYLTNWQKTALSVTITWPPGSTPPDHAVAQRSVERLHRAGVPILAGSDAPNAGTAHGPTMHHELRLLVEAGLTPREALRAATSAAAEAFGLEDRGRIASGLRADLVLVRGNPLEDIRDTRKIVHVWQKGALVDRETRRERRAAERAETGPTASAISDFESGKIEAAFGSGFSVSTDELFGGQSTAEMSVAASGANSTGHSLSVEGVIREGAPYRWAGVLFSPGPEMFSPADLSASGKLAFWVKGGGSNLQLMVFASSLGRAPATVHLTATRQWTYHEYEWSRFADADASAITAILFSGGPEPGEFEFQLDELALK